MIRVLLGLALLLCSFGSWAFENFTIRPYIIFGENNQLELLFQTSLDQRLTFKIHFQNKGNGEETFERKGLYRSEDLNRLNLGTFTCDSTLHYEVLSETRSLILRKTEALPCKKSQSTFIGFMSDTQIKNSAGQRRADELSSVISDLHKSYPFPVIINAGDIVQHGGRGDEWVNYFKTADPYLQYAYLISAIGNHEYFESEHMDQATPEFLKYMRDEKASEVGYTAIEFEHVTLIVLNSNFKFMSEAVIREQWQWLEEKLQYNQKMKRPVMISMHHSPFSSSIEWIRSIPKRLRAEFVPMIENYSCVKVVLTGHLHMYERSFKNDIHYVVAGPSGGIMNEVSYINPYKLVLKPLKTTFTLLQMLGDELTMTTYDTDKKVIDSFEVSLKVD